MNNFIAIVIIIVNIFLKYVLGFINNIIIILVIYIPYQFWIWSCLPQRVLCHSIRYLHSAPKSSFRASRLFLYLGNQQRLHRWNADHLIGSQRKVVRVSTMWGIVRGDIGEYRGVQMFQHQEYWTRKYDTSDNLFQLQGYFTSDNIFLTIFVLFQIKLLNEDVE